MNLTQIPEHPNHSDREWLMQGETNKTVYFVAKKKNEKKYKQWYPNLVKIKEGNGFVFYRRPSQIKQGEPIQ